MLSLTRSLTRLALIVALVPTNAAAQPQELAHAPSQSPDSEKKGLLWTGAALIGGGLGLMAVGLVDECRRTGGYPPVICRDQSPGLAASGLIVSILGSGALVKAGMGMASRKQLLVTGAALVGGGIGLTALGFGEACTYKYEPWGAVYQSCKTRSEGTGWGGLTVATLGSVVLGNAVQRRTIGATNTSPNTVPSPFADLSDHLKLKDTVSITETDGRRTDGSVAELTPSSLTIVVNEMDRRTFPVDTLRRITVKDRVWDGALIGLVAGTVPAAAFWTAFLDYAQHDLDGGRCDEKHRCQNPFPAGLAAGLVTGGLPGAALGAGIDAAIHRSLDVSRPRGVSLTVSPLISRDRKAVMASLRF